MSNILRLCLKCQTNPATIYCIDCEDKMCYSCDQKVHNKLKQHKTDIIPYQQMKQIKSTSFIISGIKDNPNISYELQQELNELEAIIEAKQQFLKKQEEKWSTQINSVETSYEKKLQEFQKEIESNENKFNNYQSSGNTTTFMIVEIKQKMEEQKQQAWKELNEKKSKLQDKECLLKDMIQAEEFCQKEIKSKEKLINQFKDLLQQQQVEIDLIKQENKKILKQLESIKALCKTNLPGFGINIDFLDKLEKLNSQQEDQDGEQQDNNSNDSKEVEQNNNDIVQQE